MGVDINSHTGVVVRAADLVFAAVTPDNRKQVAQLLLQLTARTLAQLKKDFEAESQDDDQDTHVDQENRNVAAMLVEVFDQLSVDSAVEDIRMMLASMTEGVADGVDSYVKRSDEAITVWNHLFEGLFPEAPAPESTEFIDAPRYQGWDLPHGEVLFVFSEDECFVRVKTSKGEALDQMLGTKTDLSTWTSYSV